MYVREKKISIEKHKIFLFQVFDFWFFTKNFHPTTVSESESESVSESELFVRIRIRIQPKHSDYFGFGFGSTTLVTGYRFFREKKNNKNSACRSRHGASSRMFNAGYEAFFMVCVTVFFFFKINTHHACRHGEQCDTRRGFDAFLYRYGYHISLRQCGEFGMFYPGSEHFSNPDSGSERFFISDHNPK
jgi:hypothetical protein